MGFSRGADAGAPEPLRRPASATGRRRAARRPGKCRPPARAAVERRRRFANVPMACPHAATATVATAHHTFIAFSFRPQYGRQPSPRGATDGYGLSEPIRTDGSCWCQILRWGAKAPEQRARQPCQRGLLHAEIGVDDRRGSGRGSPQVVRFMPGRSFLAGLLRHSRKAQSKDLANRNSGWAASNRRQEGRRGRRDAGSDVRDRVDSAHAREFRATSIHAAPRHEPPWQTLISERDTGPNRSRRLDARVEPAVE